MHTINTFFNKPATQLHLTYEDLRDAVVKGNVTLVKRCLDNPECPLSDPLEDAGYPDEDGFNPTVLHSLLYEAVPYPAVLKVLLRDKRIDPSGINNDAFYRCLYSGSIAGLKCFQECDRFIFPDNTLIKAAELGGKDLMKYLLSLDVADTDLFLQQLDQALVIAEEYNDKFIIDMLHETRSLVAVEGSKRGCLLF